ncbi:MAG: CPBP family intramembrane metalloprotease [Planctomycetales bacterium]|nr:CPBP family intramembrane metalloprotease [Planctomycetales bacterium]
MQNRKAVLSLAVIFPTLITWIYFVALSDHAAGIQQAAYSIGKVIQFVAPAVLIYFVSRTDYGHKKPQSSELLLGAISGATIAGAMWVLFHFVIEGTAIGEKLATEVNDKIAGLQLDRFGAFVGTAIFYAACHSLLEEYYWRWFVFGQLRKDTTLVTAIAISSFGFMAHHVIVLAIYLGWNSPLTYAFAICIAIGGAGWAWMYSRFGSLYGAWLSHAIVDAGIFFVGYQMLKATFAE